MAATSAARAGQARRPPSARRGSGGPLGVLLMALVVTGAAAISCTDDESPAPPPPDGGIGAGGGSTDGGTGAGGGGGTRPDAGAYGTVWRPFVEWSFDNPSYQGNPFDLVATVTFSHTESGTSHRTEMFYAGGDTWNVRFTGTRVGLWSWQSTSDDPELDGLSGSVWMDPNPGVNGFVAAQGDNWVFSGTDRAFVPQLVMYAPPDYFHNQPAVVDADIERLMVQHGFSGFHIPVFCRWAQLDEERCDLVSDRDPDLRTFEALEMAIDKVHAVGGSVHLWAWGDHSRHQTPIDWDGLNGADDQRIQRYIAARLGPLPGWTIGYGYDLDEWVVEQDLATWHDYLHQHLGWSHLLGGRSAGPNQGTDHSGEQIYEGLDYSGYEHHRPTYDVYVAAITARPNKPTFSEDRFRVRTTHPEKDYDEPMTRRGLYHSVMAGGVANIWGHLLDSGTGGDPTIGLSNSYEHPEWIRTHATFFASRFFADMERCNGLTDGAGVCLKRPDDAHFVFYQEDTSSVMLDLSSMAGEQPAVAVDTLLPYAEIDIGPLSAQQHTWSAPRASDWVIAVGNFP